jgi:hypothetical protein
MDMQNTQLNKLTKAKLLEMAVSLGLNSYNDSHTKAVIIDAILSVEPKKEVRTALRRKIDGILYGFKSGTPSHLRIDGIVLPLEEIIKSDYFLMLVKGNNSFIKKFNK